MEASVHIIQASVPQGLSSHLTEASKKKQKPGTKLQLVTDEAEKTDKIELKNKI